MIAASNGIQLRSVSDAQAPECDSVRQWLREYNWTTNPSYMGKLQQSEHAIKPLVLLASSADSRVVGGLFAETQLAWLRISIIAVHPDRRSRGVGSRLLAEAEEQALARGCRLSYVDSMDYQAPGFYVEHGYAIVGTLPNWDSHGHGKHFLMKHLRA